MYTYSLNSAHPLQGARHEFEDVRSATAVRPCGARRACRSPPLWPHYWDHGAAALGKNQPSPAFPDAAQQLRGADQDRNGNDLREIDVDIAVHTGCGAARTVSASECTIREHRWLQSRTLSFEDSFNAWPLGGWLGAKNFLDHTAAPAMRSTYKNGSTTSRRSTANSSQIGSRT